MIPNKYKVKFDGIPYPNYVVIIDSYKAVKNFTKKYDTGKGMPNFRYVDFNKIVLDYAGIEFNNYDEIKIKIIKDNKISDYGWFFLYDVNGGVVWKTDNIKIKQIDSIT